MRGGVLGRDGEVLRRTMRANDTPDQFEVPRQLVERGWSLQWVATSCHGESKQANVNNHMAQGWRPVPASRCPGLYHPENYNGPIERGGLMLCERPDELTLQALNEGRFEADRQRNNQQAEFYDVEHIIEEGAMVHRGGYEASSARNDSRGVARPKMKRALEGAPTALYPQRSLAVGDED